jgi:hypothetical protein
MEEEEDLLLPAVMQCHKVPILSEHYSSFIDNSGLRCIDWIDPCFRLWNWFTSVDLDRSGAISPIELGL